MSTGIQWTDDVWNPTVGCDQVSPGCDHCYAKTLHDMRHRAVLAGKDLPPQYAEPFETVQLMPSRLDKPLHWRAPRRVFVNSVSDLFHADVPDEYIDRVFASMVRAHWHTFQILTKRAGRMRSYMNAPERVERVNRVVAEGEGWKFRDGQQLMTWPRQNIWLGVSVENNAARGRISTLIETPAAVRFLSCEPLLETVDLKPYLWRAAPGTTTRALDWVIIGGESGKGARPCDVAGVRRMVALCQSAGVAVFVKQLGAEPGFTLEDEQRRGNMIPSFHHSVGDLFIKKLKDAHGGDPDEWPNDLRVREFPVVRGVAA